MIERIEDHPLNPARVRPVLRSARAFRRYSRQYPGHDPVPEAAAIAGAIIGKHTSGFRRRPSGEEVIEAFRRGPRKKDEVTQAILWAIDSLSTPECIRLAVRCNVRYEQIARFVRAKARPSAPLVRFLNQFTVGR